ncbi:MAG TPA: peptidoglycan DD-metalloendopeptidase family protein [Rhizomicrobium sp.]|nr:peptidoglycan DD-metalloendopeptidase family protein [Rhizomicrobium sp.]
MQRLAALMATALISSVLLSGCLAESSRTELDWNPASDAAHRPRTALNTPPHHLPATHHRPPIQTAALDCPLPRAKPGGTPAWYNNTAAPPVTQPATYTPTGGTLAFAWPVTGPVIADYGTTVSGERNDGINIAIPYGTPIHAAAAGQISYAGNELRGYGNLVLIKHDDGYVTAYAHAERIVVNRGDYVAKGQVIGYAGQTGDVTSPQLHFEIRKGVAPVNPHSLLVASRSS